MGILAGSRLKCNSSLLLLVWFCFLFSFGFFSRLAVLELVLFQKVQFTLASRSLQPYGNHGISCLLISLLGLVFWTFVCCELFFVVWGHFHSIAQAALELAVLLPEELESQACSTMLSLVLEVGLLAWHMPHGLLLN